MNNPACHFVYAGNPDSGIIQTPNIITHKLYYFLKTKFETVHYYDWNHTGNIITPNPGDVIIAHPNYPENTVTNRLFSLTDNIKCYRTIIHPFHTNRTEDNWPFDHLARRADKIFAICAPYWYDTIDSTIFAHWKPKMVRMDLAVNKDVYPHLKHTFNPPEARRLVYIGSSTPNKNLGYLIKIMLRLKDVTLHWYGGDKGHRLARLPNVQITGWVKLDDYAKEICRQCDIMVSVSNSDANPTTLLETKAWGLMAACTKESGYYNDQMFEELHLDNFPRTMEVLNHLLNEDINKLSHKSLEDRKIIETKYTWERFCRTIWDGLKEHDVYTGNHS